MTKSIYEKEPMFRDFARNIPLSQSIDDSTSLHSLKRDFQSWCLQRTPHLEDLTLSSHLQDKTDFTSRRAKCCLNVTKAKLRLPSSFPISTSITGTLPEALKGKQVAKVGKDGRRDICVPDWFEDTYHEVGNKHASETTRLKPSNFTQREE